MLTNTVFEALYEHCSQSRVNYEILAPNSFYAFIFLNFFFPPLSVCGQIQLCVWRIFWSFLVANAENSCSYAVFYFYFLAKNNLSDVTETN